MRGTNITKEFGGSYQLGMTGGEAVTELGSLISLRMMFRFPHPNNRDQVAGFHYNKLGGHNYYNDQKEQRIS